MLELEIDSLAHGGRGVAREEGLVVFVSGALPGDRVRAEVTKSKRRFAEARKLLDEAHDLYIEAGDRHLAGRALLIQAHAHLENHEPDEAIPLIQKADAPIDSAWPAVSPSEVAIWLIPLSALSSDRTCASAPSETSSVMRALSWARTSWGRRAQSAVMPSTLVTARRASTFSYVLKSPWLPTALTGRSTANACHTSS